MPHHAQVAHHVRGRIRLKVLGAKQNRALLDKVAESMGDVKGVRRIESNASTGSVLVHYDPSQLPQMEETVAAHGRSTGLYSLAPPQLSEVDQIAQDIEREAEFLAEHSETARAIVDAFKGFNNLLKKATNNNVDLKVLLPLGLAVWAFMESDPEIATPLWLTLGIFSFNSFVALHPPLATETAMAPEAVQKAPTDGAARTRGRKTSSTRQT